jgi:hypothetical protein
MAKWTTLQTSQHGKSAALGTWRRLLLALGLLALALAACSPDDSGIIQTQTQTARDAFNTRVAVVREESQATSVGQDLISALMEIEASPTGAAPAEMTPTAPLSEAAIATLAEPSPAATTVAVLPTDTQPTEVVATPTLILPTNTLVPEVQPTEVVAEATPVPIIETTPAPDLPVSTLEQPVDVPATEANTVALTPAPNEATPVPLVADSAPLPTAA